jgi:hypothetical protein
LQEFDDVGSLAKASGSPCVPKCMYFNRYCGGSYTYTNHSHVYTNSNGQGTLCSYQGKAANTRSVCTSCQSSNYNYGNHSHGWINHDSGCGWTNSGSCQL